MTQYHKQCAEHASRIASSRRRVDAPSRPVPTSTDQTRPPRPADIYRGKVSENTNFAFYRTSRGRVHTREGRR